MARSGLREKLILILMAITLVGVLLSGLGFIGISYVVERQRSLVAIKQVARVVGNNCRAAIMFNISEDAEAVLASLATQPSIRAARIVTADGDTLAEYHPVGSSVALPDEIGVGHRFRGGGLASTQPIGPADAPLGYITIFDDLRMLREQAVVNMFIILCSQVGKNA